MDKKNNSSDTNEKKINRKEALKKVGRYSAFTAAAMMLILNPVDGDPKKKSPKPPRTDTNPGIDRISKNRRD